MTEFNNQRPIFIQLAEMIEERILSGKYPEESQIPSITEMSVEYQLNPATALKGVNILVDLGLVYKKRGLGMFVSSGAFEKLKAIRKETFYKDYILPMVNEAENLDIDSNELIEMIKRREK